MKHNVFVCHPASSFPPFIIRYPEADILVSADNLASSTEPGDEGLELATSGGMLNIGIMYFK